MKILSIGVKIFLGFIILTTMLVISGALSIYELFKAGTSVELMLEDNYKSINASEKMIEALEREDSGILLLLMGRWEEGREILSRADSAFSANLSIAYNNLTIPGEREYVERLVDSYIKYKDVWEKPIVGTQKEGDLNWYYQIVHKDFLSTKQNAEQLRMLNDNTLYQTASELKNRTQRSIMPGIISIATAILFALVFYYFVNYYFVKPILRIKDGIEQYIENGKPYNVTIETKDELSLLNESVTNLCSYQRNN